MNSTVPLRPSNQIRVSDSMLPTMKRSSEKDPDYRIACIKDYIQQHKGEVMTTAQLSLAAYGHDGNKNYVSKILKKLARAGRVTKTKIKTGQPGPRYTYVWHEQRIIDPDRSNSRVIVKPLDSTETTSSSESQVTSSDYYHIIQQAKEFSWSNNTDSLRDFIKFLSTIVKKEQ